MSLVSCRACGHQVDTSALACPSCGATDPAKKLSRQQRNLIIGFMQFLIWALVLSLGSIYIYTTVIPMVKTYITK